MEERTCQNCKSEFVIEAEDFKFYKKIDVPPPTFCPECRRQRRLSWRNDFYFYSRKCDLCKKPIISLYSSDKPFPVFCGKCWWSDKWDPLAYGMNYDFSRPFFEQFDDLQRKVPALALINDNGIASQNCEYTQDFAFGKNCYLTIIAWKVEDCLYGYYIVDARDIADSMNVDSNSQLLYEAINAHGSYNSRFIYNSSSLLNCAFCYDCRDSSDCFLSIGLRHKRYYIKNKPYTKNEYQKILASYNLNTYSGVERAKKEFMPLLLGLPHRFANIQNSVDCKGDDLYNCKNTLGFNVRKAQDCKYFEAGDGPKDSYDMSTGGEHEQCYEGLTPDHSYQGLFTIFSWKNSQVAYVKDCHSSSNLFGCISLKKGKYTILNRAYAKEEYIKLKEKIINQMNNHPYKDRKGNVYRYGEFFPSELSPFGYNETIAGDYYPIEKAQAIKKGFKWQDNLQITLGKETLKENEIPDDINDVTADIINQILSCNECKRNYRIVPQEFSFYKRMQIPLPRKCFYCRHRARLVIRNPYALWHRRCQCAGVHSENTIYKNTAIHFHNETHCPNEFETTYAPERKEIVYCDKCYQAEIV